MATVAVHFYSDPGRSRGAHMSCPELKPTSQTTINATLASPANRATVPEGATLAMIVPLGGADVPFKADEKDFVALTDVTFISAADA